MKLEQLGVCHNQNKTIELAKPAMVPLHHSSRVQKVIAIAGENRGDGCSMVTSLLAVCMQRRGFRVGVLDANFERPSIAWSLGANQTAQGDNGTWTPVRNAVGIDIMSINLFPTDEKPGTLTDALLQMYGDVIWKDVDILFVNLPALGQQVDLPMFGRIKFDGLLAVTTPHHAKAQATLGAARLAGISVLGIIENFSPPSVGKARKAVRGAGAPNLNPPQNDAVLVLGRIPLLKQLASGQEERMVETFEGNWLEKAADVVELLLD